MARLVLEAMSCVHANDGEDRRHVVIFYGDVHDQTYGYKILPFDPRTPHATVIPDFRHEVVLVAITEGNCDRLGAQIDATLGKVFRQAAARILGAPDSLASFTKLFRHYLETAIHSTQDHDELLGVRSLPVGFDPPRGHLPRLRFTGEQTLYEVRFAVA